MTPAVARAAAPQGLVRGLVWGLLMVLLAGGAWSEAQAQAASAGAPVKGLPGYSSPVVGATACKLVSASRRDCLIPGMTLGRYRIVASDSSYPIGVNPRQKLSIIAGDGVCAEVLDISVWSGSSREITATCDMTVLSDQPVPVIVVYADQQAIKDASGPKVRIVNLEWTGILDMKDRSGTP